MPYPREHAARVKEPSAFIDGSFRRKVISKGIILILGKLRNDSGEMVTQSYRFDKSVFTASEALNWLKDHEIDYIKFEPATDSEENQETIDLEERLSTESENRVIQTDYCFCRSMIVDDVEQHFVDGIGIVYNSETELYPGVYESIMPGAFSQSLNRYETIKSFINHDASRILSTTRSKPPLEILDNDENLQFIAPIPPTTYGNDLVVNLKRENIRGASFSFMVNPNGDKFRRDEDGNLHRTIVSAEIYEVGPVTNPAYKQTEIALRSKEYFDNINNRLMRKDNSDNELQIINEFLSKRKGL